MLSFANMRYLIHVILQGCLLKALASLAFCTCATGCSYEWKVLREEESKHSLGPLRHEYRISVTKPPTPELPIIVLKIERLPIYQTQKRRILEEVKRVDKDWAVTVFSASLVGGIAGELVAANENNDEETRKTAKEIATVCWVSSGIFGLTALVLPRSLSE